MVDAKMTVRKIDEMTRRELVNRLVEILRYERTYGDVDTYRVEAAAIEALLKDPGNTQNVLGVMPNTTNEGVR